MHIFTNKYITSLYHIYIFIYKHAAAAGAVYEFGDFVSHECMLTYADVC